MDLVRKLLMSPMSRKKNANNSNKRLSMPVCSSQTTNVPLKSRNRDASQNQSSVSISLHQSSSSLLSNSSGELKYFGESLQDILARERGKVPRLVVAASQFICDKGLQQEGLFRVSGNARAIENLKMAIGKTGDVVIGNHNEVGTVASLLKLFFRQLPDSLIPQDMTESFLRLISNDSYSTERCFRELRRLCEKLPPCNYTTLKYLVQLLVLVARHENSNKMSPQALGIVFGPNIFRTNMKNQGLTNYIVTCFITGYDRIFRTSEEVFSVDAGEISHPNIMRPAPSRPRRYSHEEGLPPIQLNQEIKTENIIGKDDDDDDDDNDDGDDDDDDDDKGVVAPPTSRSAPPPTPRSLTCTTDSESSRRTSNVNIDHLLGSEIQNDESQHSLRCLEEEISEVISSVLFPTDVGDRRGSADSGVAHEGSRRENTGTLKKRKVKKIEHVIPPGIDNLPSHSLLKNYRRPQGPKNRRLPSTHFLRNSAGNTTLGTPRRGPKVSQDKSGLSGDRNQFRNSLEIAENPLVTSASFYGNKKAKGNKSINQMTVKGVKIKETPVKATQPDRNRLGNKKWAAPFRTSGSEIINGTMTDREKGGGGGNDGDEFSRRKLKPVQKVDSIFQERAEFVQKRKVLTPGIRHSVQCQRSSLRNNNNTESLNVAANNSCTCGIDDDDDGRGSDDKEVHEEDDEEEEMQDVAEEEELRDHESEVENVSVSHETVENFKIPLIDTKPCAFGSTPFSPNRCLKVSEDESPKEPPRDDPASPSKNPISEDGDFPTTGDDANDSAAEGLSLFMNLSQPSLGDIDNPGDDVKNFKMHKSEEHVRRGSKHFSCDRKSDSADDEDEVVKADAFKGHISSMEVQDVNSKRQSLTSLDKITNYSSNESQASVEEQIQECVADLQRFRDSLRILEEKYIARYNQKPSKIARMIDKDMSYYESQIKRCRLMLRKLRKLKEQLPRPLPELLSSDQVKAPQSTHRSTNPGEVGRDVGDDDAEKVVSGRHVSTDAAFCGDLEKKKEKIEMLRSQLFHQQQLSPHSSPKTHRARKMSASSPGVGGAGRPGNQSRREGTKSLSPSRHLLHDSKQYPHHHHHHHHHHHQQQLEGDSSTMQLFQSIDHHHHDLQNQQQQQQQQLAMDSPPQHKRQILLQPISQELPDGLKEMKRSMESLEKELEQMRIADNRNFSINLMTREELKKEKTDMQKALLKFESNFGRPTSRMEKSLVKSIYARYSEVKKELRRFDESSRVSPVEVKTPLSAKSHNSNMKVTPFPEFCVDDRAKDFEEENRNLRANDGECEDEDVNSSLTGKNSMEDLEILLNKFSLGQLVDERMRLVNMKMKLSTELKTFEREFIKFNGREIQKTEKLLKQDEYIQLKELKAHLRLVENLIDKKWREEENRNK